MPRERHFEAAAAVSIALYVFLFGYVSFLKLQSFSYHDWDLAAYNQFLFNALRGDFYSSLFGTNFLGNHLHLSFLLILPIYAILPHPFTLLAAQSLMIGVAAWPLFLIVRKELNSRLGLLFVLLYLLHPGIEYSNLNEFHPESFFPFLFFFLFYSLINWRPKPFLVFLLLTLALKENFSLAVGGLGLYCIFEKKKKLGTALISLSCLWFLLAFFAVMPFLNKGALSYSHIYPALGSTPSQIIGNILLHPLAILRSMLEGRKVAYLGSLLLPISFLPVLGFKSIILVLPLLFQHLLSQRETDCSLYFFYSFEILPPVFISAIYGFKAVYGRLGGKTKKILVIAVLLIAAITSLSMGPLPGIISRGEVGPLDDLNGMRAKMIGEIPRAASVMATFDFLPRLSNRKALYSFHYAYIGHNSLDKDAFGSIDYALIDVSDLMTFRAMSSAVNYRKMQDLFIKNNWKVLDYAETLFLLKRDTGGSFDLCREVSEVPKAPGGKPPMAVDGSIELTDFETRTGKNNFLDVTFFWKCIKPTGKDINLILAFVSPDGRLLASKVLPICYRIYPTNSWKKGQAFEDRVRISIPPAALNSVYEIKMGFFDYDSKDFKELECK